jgi:hypothetical protein
MTHELLEMELSDEEVFENTSARIFHADGVESTVYRELIYLDPEDEPAWIAVKVVSFRANEKIKPHDVLKEFRILRDVAHPNVG